jgi:hypothetical protein
MPVIGRKENPTWRERERESEYAYIEYTAILPNKRTISPSTNKTIERKTTHYVGSLPPVLVIRVVSE